MITYDRRLPLISDHIAKTGGTSFRRNLEAWFGDRLVLHYADETAGTPPPRHRLTRRWRGGFRPDVCVHGHFNQHLGWGPADYYPEVVQFITWVREPVELQSSMFSFQLKQRGGGVYRRDGVEHVTQDIEEFFERSRCPFFRGFPRPVTAENLDELVDRHFIHVGVLETMERSLRLMADKLGKPVVPVHHVNRAERVQQPSETAVRRFKERFELEYRFYELACRMNR
jgi:hypothetical protein